MPPIVIGTSLEPDWKLIGTSPWDKREKYKRDSGLILSVNAEKASKTKLKQEIQPTYPRKGERVQVIGLTVAYNSGFAAKVIFEMM